MATLKQSWDAMQSRTRHTLAAGTVLIVLVAIGLGWWAYRTDYQVLFADMAAGDAAAMTAELERSKTPYRLVDNGNTILVPQEMVYKTRLKLMGQDLPLRGAVGFEVFNNADFGMTEFVQKVNYQRAVQGELTRTIQAIDDVQSVRVHLAIPEQGLFKKTGAKPKASITVSMKPMRAMAPEQVAGIQRLVAAAVPDMLAADVTVVDQHGVALTRVAAVDGASEGGASVLDAKRSTEEYLQRKVTAVLDRTFGPGQAVASIDVVLNMDQTRVTTDEAVPAKAASEGQAPTGVVLSEKQSARDSQDGASGKDKDKDGGSPVVTSSESTYQVGRRVEQTVSAQGATRRLTIAVVVKKSMSDAQIERLKEVVGLAAGLNSQRGDAIVVYPMDRIASADAAPLAPAAAVADGPSVAPVISADLAERKQLGMVLLALLAVGLILALLLRGRRQQRERKRLDQAARVKLAGDIRQWIDTGAAKEAVMAEVRQ